MLNILESFMELIETGEKIWIIHRDGTSAADFHCVESDDMEVDGCTGAGITIEVADRKLEYWVDHLEDTEIDVDPLTGKTSRIVINPSETASIEFTNDNFAE